MNRARRLCSIRACFIRLNSAAFILSSLLLLRRQRRRGTSLHIPNLRNLTADGHFELEGTLRHQSTSSVIRVLVSDDTRVHTELLADALRRDDGLHVTTSTSGSASLIARHDFQNVDVLLLSST